MKVTNKFTTIVVLFALALNLIPLSAAASPSQPGERLAARCPDSDVHILRVAPGKSLEVLKGMRALSHLRNLQSRRPDVFAKSEVRLRARGWVPTETVVVFRSLRDTIATTSAVTTLETTITSDEGEVTFWSWNDGDNGTWEGEMFASRYEDSAEVGTAGQIDIRTAAPVVLWEEVFYKKPGTGEDFQEPLSASPISRNSGSTSIGSIQPNKMNTTDFFWDWVDCVVATCLTAIVGCASVGPGYIECVVLFCHAGVIGCAVAKIIRYIARG